MDDQSLARNALRQLEGKCEQIYNGVATLVEFRLILTTVVTAYRPGYFSYWPALLGFPTLPGPDTRRTGFAMDVFSGRCVGDSISART